MSESNATQEETVEGKLLRKTWLLRRWVPVEASLKGSKLTLDGKVLDLTNAKFAPGGSEREFKVICSGSSFHLAAESDSDLEQWMSAFLVFRASQRGAKGDKSEDPIDLRIKIRTNKDGMPSVVRTSPDVDQSDDAVLDLSAATVAQTQSNSAAAVSATVALDYKVEPGKVLSSTNDSLYGDSISKPTSASECSSTLDSGSQALEDVNSGPIVVHGPPSDQHDEDTVMFGLSPPADTQDSETNDGPLLADQATSQSSSVRRNRTDPAMQMSRVVSRLPAPIPDICVEDAFEYQWPPVDVDPETVGLKDVEPDWFMVQEVVSEMLQVKSFKRKYPDLVRRPVDSYEKAWLIQESLVPTTLADLGLTALRSEDLLAVMERDYPEVHAQVAERLHERRIQVIKDKQKEQYQTSRVERGARLEHTRKKALKSAVEYNRRLVRERKRERRSYWDLQTMQIHVNRPIITNAPNAPLTDSGKGSYPVALIPGQFAERTINYTPQELGYLPVNRCLYTAPRAVATVNGGISSTPTPLRPATPMSQSTSTPTTTLSGAMATASSSSDTQHDGGGVANSSDSITGVGGIGGEGTSEGLGGDEKPALGAGEMESDVELQYCVVCKEVVQDPVCCSDCQRLGHPKCLELPDNMLQIVKTYAWSCMECKKCVECLDPGHEELMMFCDRCDRGYHAFCVGLNSIPDGQWECPSCLPDSPEDDLPLAKVRRTVRGRRTNESGGGSTRRLFQSVS